MEVADDVVICSEPGEVEVCPGDKNKSQEMETGKDARSRAGEGR